MLIDTHCHLDFPEFSSDLDEVIARAKANGVEYLVNIAADIERSRKSVTLAGRYDCIYATVGVHPHDADNFQQQQGLATLKALAKEKKVVAIGEIGLDFYKNYSRKENQIPLFYALLGLAKDLGLPVVIHSRQADSETLKILKEVMPVQAVIHCFSGGEDFLKACLALGFFISFTCNITYKKAELLRQLAGVVPLDRLMLETDAPFLSPEGFRGKRNEPHQVKLLGEEIARIRGVSFEEIARVTTENAKQFFTLP